MKKIVSTVLVLAMVICAIPTFSASAATTTTERELPMSAPRYVNIVSISLGIDANGKYALTVIGASNVTSISAVLQIQKKNSDGSYSNYGSSWTESSAMSYLRASGTKTIGSGTYRLKATVTAVSDVTSTEVVYS